MKESVERVELGIIADQVTLFNEQDKELKAEITTAAKTFLGYENLIFIKVIGEIGAAILLITIVNIGNFAKSSSLAVFLDMTPSVSHSNDSLSVGQTTKRSSKIVCTTLVQCALIAVPYGTYLCEFHKQIKSERDKALIAVASLSPQLPLKIGGLPLLNVKNIFSYF